MSNKAAGAVHEFLVARLTTDPDKVPFNDTTGTVKEDMLQDVVELGDLEPGRSGTIDLDLKPGKYLMFCNLPGHYQAGMYRVLTVTQ